MLYDSSLSFFENEILRLKQLQTNINIRGIEQYTNINDNTTAAERNWYYNAISRVSWIMRSGVWSLSLQSPNSARLIGNVIGGTSAQWNIIYKFHYQDYQYVNTQNTTKYNSMKNQYACHVNYLASIYKPEFNLEPATPDKGAGFWTSWPLCN